MIYVGVDKRVEAAFFKKLKQINDDTLGSLFSKNDMFLSGYTDIASLFTDKAAALKKLFPVNFDEFKRCYERTIFSAHAAAALLSEMIFIEYAPVDFSSWEFLDKYFTPDAEKYIPRQATPSMIADRHKDVDELREKITEYPLATRILLPALAAVRTTAAYACLLDIAESAGIEDSLRYSVFDTFLTSDDADALAYFTTRAIKDRLTRFKVLKDAMTHSDIEYAVKFTPDEYIKILDAVAKGDCEKYITSQNGAHRLLAVGALARFRTREFGDTAKRLFATGDENIRRTVMYVLSCERFHRTELLACVADVEPTIAEFAALTTWWIDCNDIFKRLGDGFSRKFFRMCVRAFDEMTKTNYVFRATDAFPVSTNTSKTTAALLAVDIAALLDDGTLAAALDARYSAMPVDARARFLDKLAKFSTQDIRACAIEFLRSDSGVVTRVYDDMDIKLTYDEAVRVSDFLKTKKQAVKHRILKEFLRSPSKDKIQSYLIGCKEDYKREIGEEMQAAEGRIDGEKLSQKTRRSWRRDETTVLTLEKPKVEFETFKSLKIPHIDGKRVEKLYADIEAFVEENKDYEYTSPYHAAKLTIGSVYEPCEYGGRLHCYPLWEKLKAVFDGCLDGYAALDMYTLCCVSDTSKTYGAFHTHGHGLKTLEALRKKKQAITAMYLGHIVALYVADFGDPDCAAEYLYAMYTAGLLLPKKNTETNAWSKSIPPANERFPVLVSLALRADRDENIKKMLKLADEELIDVDSSLGGNLLAKAYERGLVEPEYLEYLLVNCPTLASCVTHRMPKNDFYLYSSSFEYPKFREFYKSIIERCVDAELERGTLKTPFTPFVLRLNEIYGTRLFAKAIVKIRGMTLVRNNSEFWFDDERNVAISKVLKTVRPAPDETFDDFTRAVSEYGITRDELIRAAVYNLDFLNFADRYLGIAGFKSAVLYFAAHLNEALSESRIEQIKEYSTIDYHDFKDGALDFDWYNEMVRTVPPDEFKRIYDNAKYITVARLHKRAQRFFDAMNGRISAAEAREHILSSRNKDYCLIYSLIPLENDDDLFKRYRFFVEFLKESKKYGAQRQLSERRTVDIAFDNLARNAGYADSSVFIYEMESRDRRVIDMYDGITADGYTLALQADIDKVKLTVTDGKGKKLASVPAAIAKLPQVAEINKYKKSEEQKRRRLKRSLEEAMENQTDFSREQILRITEQPLIRAFFLKLVLTDGTNACMLDGQRFTDIATGEECASDEFRIAHPVALRQNGTLRAAMKFVISHAIKQPFKQVFREMYAMSDGEREVDEVLRYKGFNVDLKKAVAALKNRGWGVSEDIGLRKVYYRKNTVAAIFREFDYYYIYDFDNENRELESIMFIDRRDHKLMKLKDVDPIVFSETLRDVDLMIAISANSVYDFDLAMSTFEMRRAMISSIIDILGLTNVTFLKENVKIVGKYGTYVVNIRTGLTFKEGKGNLLIKTIDNYDKPLALDFIDEDPMTADIVTKTLILAADADVKDPALLAELCD